MKAYVITLSANKPSFQQVDDLINSSITVKNDFEITKFLASEPKDVKPQMRQFNLRWNYPWNGEVVRDIATGLTKTGYQTANPDRRIACFLSHYRLWMECVGSGEDLLILEHDAFFHKKLNIPLLRSSRFNIIAINEPQPGATPRAKEYKQKVIDKVEALGLPCTTKVPYVKPTDHPAGLPGNSAYYIKPAGAKKLIELVQRYGAWPNDAIMCRQLLEGDLGISYPFFTKVTSGKSTTTL